jgi:hypothetical protein
MEQMCIQMSVLNYDLWGNKENTGKIWKTWTDQRRLVRTEGPIYESDGGKDWAFLLLYSIVCLMKK